MSPARQQRWWHRFLPPGAEVGPRVSGAPPSANGASSLHLRWDVPGDLRACAVTIEVVEPPAVDRLYFWAVQADFVDARGRPAGGAHLGLQWHPEHPGGTAVNWGGYGPDGRILDGTASALPSALSNPHTRDFAWRPHQPYRLAIEPVAPDGAAAGPPAWRGSVTGPDGVRTVVRDLLPAAERIGGVVMWSEVFARCDDPSAAVRWSAPSVERADGEVLEVARVSVNYQSHADGGCANTSSNADDVGVVQRTATERTTAQGGWLAVPRVPS